MSFFQTTNLFEPIFLYNKTLVGLDLDQHPVDCARTKQYLSLPIHQERPENNHGRISSQI